MQSSEGKRALEGGAKIHLPSAGTVKVKSRVDPPKEAHQLARPTERKNPFSSLAHTWEYIRRWTVLRNYTITSVTTTLVGQLEMPLAVTAMEVMWVRVCLSQALALIMSYPVCIVTATCAAVSPTPPSLGRSFEHTFQTNDLLHSSSVSVDHGTRGNNAYTNAYSKDLEIATPYHNEHSRYAYDICRYLPTEELSFTEHQSDSYQAYWYVTHLDLWKRGC